MHGMSDHSVSKKKDYAIGYGRPPDHGRFKKGQSGNPTGRRRYTDSERAKQLLRQEANRPVSIREGDKAVRIPALQAAIRSIFYSAAKGSSAAQKMVLTAMAQLGEVATGENNRIEVTWLPPQYSVTGILEELDLSALPAGERTQFEQILARVLPKTCGE
jgi:hypothetical protein